jgi:ATP-dependent DNA helicase RecQ
MEAIQHILQKYWGYHKFRPLQADIIQAVLSGKDVLALLPTGGGKSICFQVPALAKPGLCLVVSPLIALMKDQVAQLKKRNIAAAAIFTGMSWQEIDLTLDNCIYGDIKLLYLSPERLQTDIFQNRVQNMQVNLLAVDEAHCISEWGYDFRPAYLQIAKLREWLPAVNILALTATAPTLVQEDIQQKLHFKKGIIFKQSFARENLAYLVKKTEGKKRELLKFLPKIAGSTIIYVGTRKKTKLISQFLNSHNLPAAYYHGGLDNLERDKKQNDWMKNQVKIMVATNAFGMGIDKPDVRLILHLGLPATLEAYYQEAGRAGRDGLPANAILLYDEQDILELRKNVKKNNMPITALKKWYQHLVNHFQIAIGSFTANPYTLDWEFFTKATKCTPEEAYRAIKQLATAGIIEVNEAFEEQSTLRLHLHHQDIYSLPPDLASYQSLIQTLLRLYGGELFSTFCSISEIRIAHQLQLKTEVVIEKLQHLHHTGILAYRQQTHQPKITFLEARQPADQLSVNTAMWQKKTTMAIKKSEAVIDYVSNQHRCRQQILLEYFDEICYQPCKSCDRCKEKERQTQLYPYEEKEIENLILAHLATAAHTPLDLLNKIDKPEEDVLASIRQLLDREVLAYDTAQHVVIKTAKKRA